MKSRVPWTQALALLVIPVIVAIAYANTIKAPFATMIGYTFWRTLSSRHSTAYSIFPPWEGYSTRHLERLAGRYFSSLME